MQQVNLFESEGLVAGVDEAGRGPLAGAVVAAAVVLNPRATIDGLADSKKLTPKRRDELAILIKERSCAWSVAWVEAAEIDRINILAATMLAMRQAIAGLSVVPGLVQVDGNRLPDLSFDNMTITGEAIVGGDDLVPAISAASIIAKTTRDQQMFELDKVYPAYDFARHKGYGTRIHLERLREFGPCPEHRRSFSPVRAALS